MDNPSCYLQDFSMRTSFFIEVVDYWHEFRSVDCSSAS